MGQVITYWRRYNLASIFDIVADNDNDVQSNYCKVCWKVAKTWKDYCSEKCFKKDKE
jgi:hypothetical protein